MRLDYLARPVRYPTNSPYDQLMVKSAVNGKDFINAPVCCLRAKAVMPMRASKTNGRSGVKTAYTHRLLFPES